MKARLARWRGAALLLGWLPLAPPAAAEGPFIEIPGFGNLAAWWISGVGIAAVVIYTLWRWQQRNPARIAVARGLSLGIAALVVALLLVESFFHLIYARTDLVSISFGSVRWFQRYFHPVNEYGYRDLPYSDERLEGKRLLAVLGDSMAAGHGTRDYHDRFSGVLQEEIGDAWVVATLAMIGWGPDLEYDNLMHFPRKPDALVLSVYYNDIEDVTTALDKNFQPVQLQRPNLLTAWFVMHSYTFNFVYWSIVMPTFLHDGAYEAYLAEVLNDEVVWSGFEAKLQPFLDYAAERNIPVAAVVFPMLHRPDITCPFDDNVLAFFREKGVPALSVAECVADLPPEARILNNMDAHPSDLVHERVGHALADLLRESGITTKD